MIFGLYGVDTTKFYLEQFVGGVSSDRRFGSTPTTEPPFNTNNVPTSISLNTTSAP